MANDSIGFKEIEELYQEAEKLPGVEHGDKKLLERKGIVFSHKNWQIELRVELVQNSYRNCTYLKSYYVIKEPFKFKIYREGFMSAIGKTLGMQDVEVGYPEFDEKFIIQGNSEHFIKQFFDSENIRLTLSDLYGFNLFSDYAEFGRLLPEDVYVLQLQVNGHPNLEQIKGLFELMAESLDQLVKIEVAEQSEPAVKV